MSRTVKAVLSLLLLPAVILFCANPVFASNVSYTGDAEAFILSPGSQESPTDLFPDFKNVLPGDTLTQRITLSNHAKETAVRLYLRSTGAEPDSIDLLSQLTLTVRASETSVLFQAPASEPAQLSDWVYLGTLYSGGEMEIEVTLQVPVSLENSFQKSIGFLNWQFKAEEIPLSPEDGPPQTGDVSIFWGLLAAITGITLPVLLLYRKRHFCQ